MRFAIKGERLNPFLAKQMAGSNNCDKVNCAYLECKVTTRNATLHNTTGIISVYFMFLFYVSNVVTCFINTGKYG